MKTRKLLVSVSLVFLAGFVIYLLIHLVYALVSQEFTGMRGAGYALGISIGWQEKILGGIVLIFFTWLLAFAVMRLVRRKK